MPQLSRALALFVFSVWCFTEVDAQFVVERSPWLDRDEGRVIPIQQQWLVWDKSTRKTLDVDLVVEGIHPSRPVLMPVHSDTVVFLQPYRRYTRLCVEPGYMIHVDQFFADPAGPSADTIPLEPLAVGLERDMPSIEFTAGDDFQVYYGSLPTLKTMVEFLKAHPTLRLAIIGHINAPGVEPDDLTCERLSRERARAVWEFLVTSGVAPTRLEIRGRGRQDMLFPNPSTPEEVDANRRITLQVIDY
ncbi:MAG: OmpA family protein [Flavobacteriales bacterium]